MQVIATLIEVTAYDPLQQQQVVGRVTNYNDPRATTANGVEWLPILETAPTVGTSVFNGDFTGAGEIQLGDFTITLVDGLGDAFTGIVWAGADIKIYAGDLETGDFPLIFRALGSTAQRKGRLQLQVGMTSRSALLDVNLLTESYAGLGLLEGDAGLIGTPKPWVFGQAQFCQPVLLDAARQIYQVSAYGPIQNVTNVYEGGQEITNGSEHTGDLNDFLTDLDGPGDGKWWWRGDHGLIRLGDEPTFPISCTVNGDTGAVAGGTALTKLGDIVGRILALTTTMAVKPGSLQRLNQLVTQPFDDYYNQQTTVTDALTKLVLSVGGYYTFDEDGDLIFGLVRLAAQPVLNLDGLNRVEPTVLGINQLPTSAPVWYLKVGAAQCHFVQTATDMPSVIAEQADAVAAATKAANDAGTLASSKNKTFPPSPQPPTGAVDGDLWPDTSVSPTTTRRYDGTSGTWVATSNQITAANQVPYNTGQTVQDLKPAQAGADVTGQNTAAALLGQGALATQNAINWLTQLLNAPGYVTSPGVAGSIKAGYVTYGDDPATFLNMFDYFPATTGSDKTANASAASIVGQGLLATQSAINWLTQLFNAPGYVTNPGVANSVKAGYVTYGDDPSTFRNMFDYFPATAGSDKTANASAAAIAGQGALATQSTVTWKSQFSGAPAYVTDPYSDNGNQLIQAGYVYYGNGQDSSKSLFNYFPATTGSDRTSNATAAAIAGQGGLATAGQISSSNVANYFSFSAFQLNYSITRADGTTIATEATLVTAQGQAASIAGQGSLATKNTTATTDIDDNAVTNGDLITSSNTFSGSGHVTVSASGYTVS